MNLKSKKGFTLLELMIVLIIIGVLASLALPRMFGMVEKSRGNEAMNFIREIRNSLERCYTEKSGTYVDCDNFSNLDVDLSAPNQHFTYTITSVSASGYTITATRNTLDGGDGSSTITVTQDSSGYTRTGTGPWSSWH